MRKNAAAAAIGSTMGPLEEAEGYDKNYSAAVNVASAPVGMLIPPSNTMIVYSTVAGSVSISALFMAGYVPGLIWTYDAIPRVAEIAGAEIYAKALLLVDPK